MAQKLQCIEEEYALCLRKQIKAHHETGERGIFISYLWIQDIDQQASPQN